VRPGGCEAEENWVDDDHRGRSTQGLPAEPRAAVAALFFVHHRPLVGLATLLVDDRETAEDVVQEAFISLYSNWSRIRDPNAATGYLRAATLNLSRSRLRRRRVERMFRLEEPLPISSADARTLDRDTRDSVWNAVAALPRRQREVVVLRYYQEMSESEIASALGISAGSVKQHASRALAALSRQLEALT
jgi:RNA polymerase sigma-70 factor (sigma-E family)